MKFSHLFFLNVFFSIIVSNGQKLASTWTDGDQLFYPQSISSGYIQFDGGTLHEGGSMFYTKILGPETMQIIGRTSESDTGISYGKQRDVLEYQILNGFEVLLWKDAKNKILGLLQKRKDLYNFKVQNKINFDLAGKYKVKGKNYIISFTPNKTIVKGLGSEESYNFILEYDTPINAFSIGAKQYRYQKTYRGLILFEGEFAKELKDTKPMELELVKGYPFTDTNLYGDYTFASSIPLTNAMLEQYSSKELRLIRNEIFARYGFVFKSADLQAHFNAMDWYVSIKNSRKISLTPLEKVNIQLLLNMEAIKKNEEITTYDLLQGKWESIDDANNVLWFQDTWRMESTSSDKPWSKDAFILADACNSKVQNDNARYLICAKIDLCWYIVSIDTTTLQLSYVGRGNTLTYKRIP